MKIRARGNPREDRDAVRGFRGGGANSTLVRSSGFSLLELLVSITIVSILLTMVVAISGKFKARAEKAKCMSQMRALHTSFAAHVEDTGSWPQLPEREDDSGWSEDEFFRFFVLALEPYGGNEEMWLCPSDKDLIKFRLLNEQKRKNERKGAKKYFGSYVPTRFAPGNHTPFRWNQPWLLERGAFHSGKSHMLLPDGSVHDTRDAFYGR